MSAQPLFDMQVRLLMIGDSGVGKTCVLRQMADSSFSPTFITTIGVDFRIKNITLDQKRLKLQVWDTAGQERFRTITTSYFRGAQGILLVYDVTDRGSFNAVRNWRGQITQVIEPMYVHDDLPRITDLYIGSITTAPPRPRAPVVHSR
jgi:Ras-related protein Rab-8A